MPDDIVAELDRWLNADTKHNKWVLIQRARDEIAATNEAIGKAAKEAYALGRAEALQEAAQLCWELSENRPEWTHDENMVRRGALACANAIRKLKG